MPQYQRRISTWMIICGGLLFLLFLKFTTPTSFPHYSTEILTSYTPSSSSARNQRVQNNTLGFEKIFVVGLPERSDKRDALALTSSLTGFKITWIDGIRGESVVDKALPYGVDRVKLWENNVGSWRGHMNAVRTIVEEGLSSALIMEDDVDWDIRLKIQLLTISHGTRSLQPSSPSKSRSPYGDDWDLIWLGHCGEIFPETLEENLSIPPTSPLFQKYTITPDPTVPPPQHVRGFQNYSTNPFTRWVHVSGGPICTFAYALSLRGARKVLFDMSVDGLAGPFDNALAGLCRWGREAGRLGMRCFSVTPPVVVHHKARGPVSGDSDIQSYGAGGEVREKGSTENIMWSTRGNIKNLMMGGEIESQFESG